MLTESVTGASKLSCLECETEPDSGLAVPNIMHTNSAKFMFAENIHQVTKIVQDIAGGIPADAPVYKDWINPQLRPYIEKYLAGKNNVPTENRLKASRLVRDCTGPYYLLGNIHGEGSLAAQTMFLYASADWDKYKAAAKRIANIDGWQSNSTYGSLPNQKTHVASKMPPIDASYKL